MPTTRPDKEPTQFSLDLSRHLVDYMDETGVSVRMVAATLGRSITYVYDHTSGLRAPDTDLLNTVARLSGVDVRTLMLNLVGRMLGS